MKSIIRKIIATILNLESMLIIRKYKPTVITVTGSVGKTSTKDAIFSVLSAQTLSQDAKIAQLGSQSAGLVRRSEKSFNSEFGVPLTIIGCDNPWSSLIGWLGVMSRGIELIIFPSDYPKCLILEVGADHPGDIKRVAKWLHPDIAVVTKIGAVPVHVEFFPSRQALVDEKLSLARSANTTAMLVLPADEPDILAVRRDNPRAALTYGVNTPADVSASSVEIVYDEGASGAKVPAGISFKLNHAGNSVPVTLRGVVGVQHVYPAVAAAAVGIARGMNLAVIVESFAQHTPPRGRMNILHGMQGITIIDDTYNASPDAVTEALATLKAVGVANSSGGRKIAILGDMMELGKFSAEEHKRIGKIAADVLGVSIVEQNNEIMGETVGLHSDANILVTIGQRAKMMREGALAGGLPESSIWSFDTSDEAIQELPALIHVGDTILIKGSQSVRMERISKALLDPADLPRVAELLVRQDPEWLAKK